MKWEMRKLGEVCEIQNGYAFKSGDYATAGHRVIRIGNVQKGEIVDKLPKYFQLEADRSLARFNINSGDILVSLTGDVGRVGVMQESLLPAALNQRVGRFQKIKEQIICKRFLFHFLNSEIFECEVIESSKGVAQKNTSTKKILEITIPVPPLSVQREIVDRLDAAFGLIDRARANVERCVVLAGELWEGVLEGAFASLSKDHDAVALESVVGFQNGFAFKSRDFKSAGIPLIRIKNIDQGVIDLSKTVYISPEDYKQDLTRYLIKQGNMLIAMSGATTGKIGICVGTTEAFLNQRVGKFEPGPDVLPEYLFLYLSTMVEPSLAMSLGSAQPNLSTAQIKEFQLPLPPMDKHQKFYLKLSETENAKNSVLTYYLLQLKKLDELRASLLDQAFLTSE